MEGHDRRHAVDDELVEGAAGALECLLAGGSGDDELGDHRVEGAGDGVALLDACVPADTGALGDAHPGHGAGGRHEVAPGVLAVDAELEGVAAGDRVVVAELLAVGDAQHLADEVDAGDLLGHGVLDLQAGVDLEEGDGAVLGDEVLAGAGTDVAGLLEDRLGGADELGVLLLGEEGGGGLLDELLVAALQRAVTRRDDDDVAVLVGEALGLDVARLVEELLDEALAAAEGRDGLADGRLVELGDLLHRVGDLESATATAVDGLDGDRQAELLGEGDDLVGVLDRVVGAGGQRGIGLDGDVLGLGLVAQRVDGLGARADPDQPGVEDGLGEVGILREEPVARVDRVGASVLGDLQKLVLEQVAVGGRLAAEGVRLVGDLDVQGVTVGLGVDGDGADASVGAGTGDADGDLAAVRDEDFADGHGPQTTA